MFDLLVAMDDPNPSKSKFKFLALVLSGMLLATVGGWAGREMLQGYLNYAQGQAILKAKADYENLAKTVEMKGVNRDKEIAAIQKQRDEDVARTKDALTRIENAVTSVNNKVGELQNIIIERLPPRSQRKVQLDFNQSPDKESIKNL